MKVAHFNTVDNIGGAAKVAFRLHANLNINTEDVESTYYVRTKTLSDSSIVSAKNTTDRSLERRVAELYINQHRTDVTNSLFSFTYVGEDSLIKDAIKYNDIFHLHWIEGFLNLRNLGQLVSSKKPIIYTLHDEKPYTGGCHCTFNCEGFTEECSNCIQLKEGKHLLPRAVLKDKIEFYSSKNIQIVAPSIWIRDQARKSSVFSGYDIAVIPHGINTDTYKYVDKGVAKKKIGLSPGAVTLMFNACNCSATHKGFRYFKEAIIKCCYDSYFSELCKNESVVLIIVGDNSSVEGLSLPTKVYGYLDSETDLASLYQATDILVNPTLADSFSLVSLEAMACGAVVAGFETGGLKDFITNKNGRLVEQKDSDALAKAILGLVSNKDERNALQRESVKTVTENYTIKKHVDSYHNLYIKLLESYVPCISDKEAPTFVEKEIINNCRLVALTRFNYIHQFFLRIVRAIPMSAKLKKLIQSHFLGRS